MQLHILSISITNDERDIHLSEIADADAQEAQNIASLHSSHKSEQQL